MRLVGEFPLVAMWIATVSAGMASILVIWIIYQES